LADRLERSDIILLLEPGDCSCRGAKSCLSFVTRAGDVRYLAAAVSLRQIQAELIEHIGHELGHAVELANAPDVVSRSTLVSFYTRARRSGCERPCGFETRQALLIQQAVRRELNARAD
jgi:hypothetical protein